MEDLKKDMEGGELFYNSKEVAEILDMSPDAVLELARRNILRATKSGRYWLFRPEDVKEYIARNKNIT